MKNRYFIVTRDSKSPQRLFVKKKGEKVYAKSEHNDKNWDLQSHKWELIADRCQDKIIEIPAAEAVLLFGEL